MCANNCNWGKNDEKKYLFSLRREILEGGSFEQIKKIAANARLLVWLKGEKAQKYNEIIKMMRFGREPNQEICSELKKVLREILN